jgi:hypothetical protein
MYSTLEAFPLRFIVLANPNIKYVSLWNTVNLSPGGSETDDTGRLGRLGADCVRVYSAFYNSMFVQRVDRIQC